MIRSTVAVRYTQVLLPWFCRLSHLVTQSRLNPRINNLVDSQRRESLDLLFIQLTAHVVLSGLVSEVISAVFVSHENWEAEAGEDDVWLFVGDFVGEVEFKF